MSPSVQYVFQQARWMSSATRELILAMGIGFKWVSMTLRTLLFGMLVGPFFLPMILWYILSPNIIRHVAYRTSKTTRARHLKSLMKRVRHVVSQKQHDNRTSAPTTPMGAGDAELASQRGKTQQTVSQWVNATGESSERLQQQDEGTWSRIASSLFLTPQRLRAATATLRTSTDTMSSHLSYDLMHDAIRPDAPATTTAPPGDAAAAESRHTSPSPVPSCLSSTSESDDDDDSDHADDHEDLKNLHNRAVLDIYLPCPLDELLRVQHRLFEGRNVQDATPATSPRKRGGAAPFVAQQHGNSAPRPTMEVKKYPIVICVSGGAWIIGCHLWGALLARILAGRGCVVFCPDYRNFPQSNMAEMTRDVSDAIAWVLRNAERYNGDLDNVTLIGQSAGAHLSWMSIISQARLAAEAAAKAAMSSSGSDVPGGATAHPANIDFGATVCNFSSPHLLGSTQEGSNTFASRMEESLYLYVPPTSTPQRAEVAPCEALIRLLPTGDARSSPSYPQLSVYVVPRYNPRKSIHRFIPLSGIYDLPHLIKHFHRRGLYRKVLYKIAGGKERLRHEFCVNKYFDTPSVVTAGLHNAAVNIHGAESPLLATTSAREAAMCGGLANRSLLPAELHKALLREGCEENAWAVDQLLMNESFVDVGTLRRRPQATFSPAARSLVAPPHSNAAPSFLDELPQRIVFLHGDNDMSAPISEPLRLYSKVRDALQARSAAARARCPVDVSVVCIEGGTHTNVIVEELLSGGGKRSVVGNFVAEELGLPPLATKGGKKRRTPPLSSSTSSSSTLKGGDARSGTTAGPAVPQEGPYRVIPMEVMPRDYNIFLRIGSYVCPF